MDLLHVGHHCCVRMAKEFIALKEKGHTVHGVGFKTPIFSEILDSFVVVNDHDKFKNVLNLHKKAGSVQLVHVHNEPNWLVSCVKEVFGDSVPIVLDVHDSMYYRSSSDECKSAAERLAFSLSDGFVFVSDKCKEMSLEQMSEVKPNCVLASHVNKRFYKYKDWKWVGGLVYEGLTAMKGKSPDFMLYADYRDLAIKCKEIGLPFHLYTVGWEKEKEEYYKDAIFGGTQHYGDLCKILGHHDWGLTGNIIEYRDWNVAMPNKFFEYMAGCIPIVAMNAENVGNICKEYGIGISVKSCEELKDRWEERQQCQNNVIKWRGEFAMENHIYKLENLYKELLA